MFVVALLLLPTLLLASLTLVACGSDGDENSRNVQVVKQGNAEITLRLPDGNAVETNISEMPHLPSNMEAAFYEKITGSNDSYETKVALYYTPEIIVPLNSSSDELVEYLDIYADGIEEIEKSEAGFLGREQTTFATYPAEAFEWLEESPTATLPHKHTKYVAFLADSRLWSFYCISVSNTDGSQLASICDDVVGSAQ